MTSETELGLVRPRIWELPTAYKLFYRFLKATRLKWDDLSMNDFTQDKDLNFFLAFTIHWLHVLSARLYATSKTGSLLSLFSKGWDPLIFLILQGNEKVGCCFLSKQSPTVFQIDTIGVIPSIQDQTMIDLFRKLIGLIRAAGGSRIIFSLGTMEVTKLLKTCGFEPIFLDHYLYFEI